MFKVENMNNENFGTSCFICLAFTDIYFAGKFANLTLSLQNDKLINR